MASDPLWFYWGGQPMKWLRYMTLLSARLVHKDIRLIVRRMPIAQPNGAVAWAEQQECTGGEVHGKDWFHDALGIVDQVIYLEDVCPELSAGISDVHVSDMLSYWILATYGGTVSDMDIVYLKPVPHIEHDVLIARHDLRKRNVYRKGFYTPVGFMQGRPCSTWRTLYDESWKRLDHSRYQCVGSALLDHITLPTLLSPFIVYPFYGCHWRDRARYLFGESHFPAIPDATIGIHWYAGGHKEYYMKAEDSDDLVPGAVRWATVQVLGRVSREVIA